MEKNCSTGNILINNNTRELSFPNVNHLHFPPPPTFFYYLLILCTIVSLIFFTKLGHFFTQTCFKRKLDITIDIKFTLCHHLFAINKDNVNYNKSKSNSNKICCFLLKGLKLKQAFFLSKKKKC
jgi:hypothetical protein